MAETKYEPGFTLSALNFAEAGMTDAQIAYRLNISRSTFYNYKRDYPEFVEAIERGRDILDATVNRNLLDLVTGEYCFITSSSDSDGRTRTTTRKAVPNLKAIQYWMERRDRQKEAEQKEREERDGQAPPCGSRKSGIEKQDKQAPPCGSRESGIDKREKLKEEEIQLEQSQPQSFPPTLITCAGKNYPVAGLDFSELAGLQELGKYMEMCPDDAGDGFSKKETEQFEDMMLVTFTEMERRKYNEKAAVEGRPQIPYTDAAPRSVRGEYSPDLIKAWKDRADYFELAV